MPRESPVTDFLVELYTDKRKAGLTQKDALTQLIIEAERSRASCWTLLSRHFTRNPDPELWEVHKRPTVEQLKELSVKGRSTLYKDGEVVMEWVKTDRRYEDAERLLSEIRDAYKAELPQIEPTRIPRQFDADCAVVIPFGDPHLGMHAWAEETGADFDLKIAEKHLCGAVDTLINATKPSAECLIANLGDFFHADNLDGTTMRSGHKLDTDTRWPKVLRVGIMAMRYCIEAAAKRHGKVTVINAIGNHDDHSSMFLSICLAHIYENEPRVTIIDKPTTTHYWRFGANLVGVHHGHSIKMDKLPLVMAAERPIEWGETKYRYWLTGHSHHDSKKEFNGVTVESFRTLAARDAYAASHGYLSGRDMKAIVLHREWGEIGRHLVNVAMLESKC